MHRTVAAFVGYRPDDQPAVQTSEQDGATPWTPPGSSIPPSAELAAADTPEAALKAAERMFFGEVKNVWEL